MRGICSGCYAKQGCMIAPRLFPSYKGGADGFMCPIPSPVEAGSLFSKRIGVHEAPSPWGETAGGARQALTGSLQRSRHHSLS